MMDDDEVEDVPVLYRLRVVRDSPDLGLDAGMVCEVIKERWPKTPFGGPVTLTLLVRSLDATICGVDPNHPDLQLIPEQLELPFTRHEDCDCSACLPPTF